MAGIEFYDYQKIEPRAGLVVQLYGWEHEGVVDQVSDEILLFLLAFICEPGDGEFFSGHSSDCEMERVDTTKQFLRYDSALTSWVLQVF